MTEAGTRCAPAGIAAKPDGAMTDPDTDRITVSHFDCDG